MNMDMYGIIMTKIVTKMTNIVNRRFGRYLLDCNLLFISNLEKVGFGTEIANNKVMSIFKSLSDKIKGDVKKNLKEVLHV